MIILLTGLPGSGKTMTGTILRELLCEGGRKATLLDGDTIREISGKKFGFTGDDRRARVIELAKMATQIDGYVICALIAPTDALRAEFRQVSETAGAFVEVYLSTPLSVCETRKPKLYQRARNGELGDYAGITSPYEVPRTPDIEIDTTNKTAREAALWVLERLPSTKSFDAGFADMI